MQICPYATTYWEFFCKFVRHLLNGECWAQTRVCPSICGGKDSDETARADGLSSPSLCCSLVACGESLIAWNTGNQAAPNLETESKILHTAEKLTEILPWMYALTTDSLKAHSPHILIHAPLPEKRPAC